MPLLIVIESHPEYRALLHKTCIVSTKRIHKTIKHEKRGLLIIDSTFSTAAAVMYVWSHATKYCTVRGKQCERCNVAMLQYCNVVILK